MKLSHQVHFYSYLLLPRREKYLDIAGGIKSRGLLATQAATQSITTRNLLRVLNMFGHLLNKLKTLGVNFILRHITFFYAYSDLRRIPLQA